MLLRNDIVSFWFWGYSGDLRIELQAPVLNSTEFEFLTVHKSSNTEKWKNFSCFKKHSDDWNVNYS